MKKVIIVALALVASATFSPASAGKKKDKKKVETTTVKAPVVLSTASDTLSYIVGMSVTEGLVGYLQQSLGVDTAYMADFVAGFNDAVATLNDPRQHARIIGMQIAAQSKGQVLKNLRKEFDTAPDTITDAIFYRAFTDALTGDTTHFKVAQASSMLRVKETAVREAKTRRLREPQEKFLEENRLHEGVITTPSGLQYEVLVEGQGAVPVATDKVEVNYEGRLIDGTVFDGSALHGGKPAQFKANQVIRGWTEALTMMPVGSKWRLYIPQNLGYGERGTGNIPPYATLIFDVELLNIVAE